MKNDLMNNFLINVETLINERQITKQDFCDYIGFPRATFVNWKHQNSLPNVATIIKVADYFKVDIKWLIFGKIELPKKLESRPSYIFDRVYRLLLEETKIPDPDYNNVSDEQMALLWKPIENIVTCYDLINWQFNRIMPTYKQLKDIALHFNKTLEYIAEGIDNEIPSYIETYKVPKQEYINYQNYKKYHTLFWSYDAMYEPDKKYVSQLIARLFRLRRYAEGRDFDNDYNTSHPLEKPRQKDPNLTEEEIDENNKKTS